MGTHMNLPIQESVADRHCPITFVVMPTFVGALLWLWAVLGNAIQ
jgi:hypothetical protein